MKIVVADDHPIVLDGIEAHLKARGGFDIAARCPKGQEVLDAVLKHEPDILILDLKMPGMGGLEVLKELRKRGNQTKVVILTAAMDDADLIESLKLGVKGIVLKEMAPNLLVQCLIKVHSGGEWLERESVGKVMGKLVSGALEPHPETNRLTSREIEVIKLASLGLRNKDIADRLNLGEGTIKVHMHNIYEKLGVDGRVALLLWAREKGLA